LNLPVKAAGWPLGREKKADEIARRVKRVKPAIQIHASGRKGTALWPEAACSPVCKRLTAF
ncbi:MAG: hypothetical protein ACM3TT_05105, partial [Syntrophothermus sp.]